MGVGWRRATAHDRHERRPPAAGPYTGIVAGFLISALGGSRVRIGGPTGAFVVIVYGIVQRHGVDGLGVATIMAGAILVAMGLARLGGAIKFIPHPVVGFTSGIALIIASGQVNDALGLRLTGVPTEFVARWATYARHASAVDPWAALPAIESLLSAVVAERETGSTRRSGWRGEGMSGSVFHHGGTEDTEEKQWRAPPGGTDRPGRGALSFFLRALRASAVNTQPESALRTPPLPQARRRRAATPSPARPSPRSATVAGSGVLVTAVP